MLLYKYYNHNVLILVLNPGKENLSWGFLRSNWCCWINQHYKTHQYNVYIFFKCCKLPCISQCLYLFLPLSVFFFFSKGFVFQSVSSLLQDLEKQRGSQNPRQLTAIAKIFIQCLKTIIKVFRNEKVAGIQNHCTLITIICILVFYLVLIFAFRWSNF